MAFLTIAGTSYLVRLEGASEAQPEYLGQRKRAFAGNLRSSRRVTKRTWSFTFAPITETAYQALRTATLNDAQVTAVGDFSNSANVTVVVEITAASYVVDNTATLRAPSVTLTEV